MTDNSKFFADYIKNNGLPENGNDNSNEYFTIEVLRRGKDHPNLPAANFHLKIFRVCSVHQFNEVFPIIKELCDKLQMRAYFSTNSKKCDQVLLDTISEMSYRAATHDNKRPWKIFDSVESKHRGNKNNSRWLFDLDHYKIDDPIIDKIEFLILSSKTSYDDQEVLRVPTKSGIHLLCRPFDRLDFCKLMTEKISSDIHDLSIKDGTLEEKTLSWLKETIKINHISLLYENL